MNEHIELAKKFLADNDSVTEEELRVNKEAAWAAYWAAGNFWAATRATRAATRAALWAFRAAESDELEDAEYYKQKAIKAIAEYEELTK